MFSRQRCFVLGLLSILTACATVPEQIRQYPAESISLKQAMADPESFRGARVRWGGEILKLDNQADATWVQVLARPLSRSARPKLEKTPLGRFEFYTEDFLDPAIFEPDREITVVGIVEGTFETTVGKRQVKIPLVKAEGYYLWPLAVTPRYPSCPPYQYYPYWRYHFGLYRYGVWW